jgi:hypothetical protein
MKYLQMLLSLFFLVLFTSNAWAVDLAWDHDNPANVEGYIIYYAPTVPNANGDGYINISDGSIMTATIPDSHFEPNVEYTIYATAHNLTGESEGSDSIVYTRHGWGPPADMPPIKLWLKPGKPKIVIIIQ